MEIIELTERLNSIGAKIAKINDALISSFDCEDDDEGGEITVAEFEMVQSLSNISEGFNNVIENYAAIKQQYANGEFDEFVDEEIQKFNNGFTLACNMVDFFVTKLARQLEIGV